MSDPNAGPSREFTELSQKLSAFQAMVGEGMAGLQTGVSDVRTLVGTRLDQLNARVDQLDAGQSKVRAEVMDRIDRLQETVELVREDARVNWATADTALNRSRNSRDEIDRLMAMIAAMERRHQTLAAIVDGLRNNGARKPDNA